MNNPYNPEFKIKTPNAQIYRVGPGTGTGTGPGASKPGHIVVQLLIFSPKDEHGEQQILDIKEQEVELPTLVPQDAFLTGWATVVKEVLAGGDVQVLMPIDFFRGFKSALELKKATTAEDFEAAFRAKTRLGKWAMVALPPVVAAEPTRMSDYAYEGALEGYVRPMTPPPPPIEKMGNYPTDAELRVIEANPEPVGEQVDLPSLMELAAATGAHVYDAVALTPAERLEELKAKLAALPRGVPFRAKRERELQHAIRRIGRKLVQSATT